MERLSVLSDFDGTVTKRDVGASIIDTFADPKSREVEEEWMRGLIGSAESHSRQYSTIKATREELEEHIAEIELEEGFFFFLEYLQREEIPIKIISDGFDFYIEHLLKKNNIELEYRSNRLFLETMEFAFPYHHETCWRCAHCKVKSVQSHLNKGERVIYIGDGLSDLYGALISDIIFAKRGRRLAKALEKRGIYDFILFETFQEIAKRLKEDRLTYRFKEVAFRECSFKEREASF